MRWLESVEVNWWSLVRSAPYIGQRRPVTSHRWSLPGNPATSALSGTFFRLIIKTKQPKGWEFLWGYLYLQMPRISGNIWTKMFYKLWLPEIIFPDQGGCRRSRKFFIDQGGRYRPRRLLSIKEVVIDQEGCYQSMILLSIKEVVIDQGCCYRPRRFLSIEEVVIDH